MRRSLTAAAQEGDGPISQQQCEQGGGTFLPAPVGYSGAPSNGTCLGARTPSAPPWGTEARGVASAGVYA